MIGKIAGRNTLIVKIAQHIHVIQTSLRDQEIKILTKMMTFLPDV